MFRKSTLKAELTERPREADLMQPTQTSLALQTLPCTAALRYVPSNCNELDLVEMKILIEEQQFVQVSLLQELTRREMKPLKFCIRISALDNMLNICNECEIREYSVGECSLFTFWL